MTRQTPSHRHALRGAIVFLLATTFAACETTPFAPVARTVSPESPIVQRLDSAVTCSGISIYEGELICSLGRSDGTFVDPLTLRATCSCFAARTR